MRYIVIYDIPDDRLRAKVADICLDYGLDRIQYSAFLGQLTRSQQQELWKRIRRKIGKKAANVQLYPLCSQDWAAREVFAQEEADGPAG
jgi:CRISPR-associated protein Cas2